MNGVEGMLYMRSTSTSDGYYTLTVTFGLETDADIAAVQVQNRVSQASGSLPQEVLAAGLTTAKTTPDTVMYVAIHSPNGTYDQLFLRNFANITVVEPLGRVTGVGNITLYGADFGMRIWLRPDAMARLGITPTDVLQAVRDQNVQAPAGAIGRYPVPEGPAFQYTVRARGRLVTEEEFRDIARVELGAEEYRFVSTYNGRPAANFAISLTPDANAIETADLVRSELARMAPSFPADVAYDVVTVLGFTVNTLTLFGMVLAIGIVVDDAISVLLSALVALALATGAAARNVMGLAVAAGMTAATVLGIFVVPVLFVVVQRLAERIGGRPGGRTAGDAPAAGAR